jgi:hypothetical protein
LHHNAAIRLVALYRARRWVNTNPIVVVIDDNLNAGNAAESVSHFNIRSIPL